MFEHWERVDWLIAGSTLGVFVVFTVVSAADVYPRGERPHFVGSSDIDLAQADDPLAISFPEP